MTVLLIIIAVFVIFFLAKGIVVVKQAEVMVLERLGKYSRSLGPGLHIIWPIIDQSRNINWRYMRTDLKGRNYVVTKSESRIDLRETVYDFPRQNVITSDNVTIEINAILYFQITDPYKALYEVHNLPDAIEKLTQTTLRNVIGELELDKTLTSRDTINTKLRIILDEATDKWGVKVNRVELQDINPPEDIRNAMEKQMRAERNKRARILEADGEKQSQVLVAEGDKKAKITRAEGEAQSKILVAQAEAEAIQKIMNIVQTTKTDPAQYMLAMKYISAFDNIVQKNDKTVVVPYESSAILGSLETIKQLFNKTVT
ncbi:MAG: SPFH domain-containing protein [Candidatus Stygibacter australis]|nr:SPFH domain-containing protein [Candidatus Stygibacter australis]